MNPAAHSAACPPTLPQAERYLSPAQQAAAAAAAAAEEERQRRAAADDAFSRALKSMMGGTLVRAVDEMADLAQARPAWMNGNTQVCTLPVVLCVPL